MIEFNQVVIFVTVDTREAAQRIADRLLERRKAACVNIVPEVDSYFWWEGKLETAQEALMVIKTRASLVDEVVGLIKELHSYDVPEIIALPIVGGNRDYLEWIDGEVRELKER